METVKGVYLDDPEMVYPDPATVETSRSWWGGQRSLGDYLFSCPTRAVGIKVAGDEGRMENVRVYHFKKVQYGSIVVPHTEELNYLFPVPPELGGLMDEEDLDISETLIAYWGNFMISHDGDPNVCWREECKELPYWPVYNVDDDEVMGIGGVDEGGVRTVRGLKEIECVYWIQEIEEDMGEYF